MSTLQPATNWAAFEQFYGLAPKQGPKTIPIVLDFTLKLAYLLDFQTPQSNDVIEFIQGLYVDNSLNSSILTISCTISNQSISVPANSQGYFPFFAPNVPKVSCVLAAATANTSTTIQFLNVPVPAFIWNAAGPVLTSDASNGPVQPGTAATKAALTAGIFNSAGVTLTNGQQAALQLTSKGALEVSGSTPVSATAAPVNTVAAYAAGVCVGGLIHITNLFVSGAGQLNALRVTLNGAITVFGSLAMYVFNASPSGSTVTDNTALNVVKADWPKITFACALAAQIPAAGVSASTPQMLIPSSGQLLASVQSGTDLWAAIYVTTATTFVSTTDIVFEVSGTGW